MLGVPQVVDPVKRGCRQALAVLRYHKPLLNGGISGSASLDIMSGS